MKYEDLLALGGDYEREARAMNWAVERGHSYEVKCLDRPIDIAHSFKYGKHRRHLRIRWSDIPSWFGDIGRKIACDWRVSRDKKRGIVNPYRKPCP